MRKIIITIIITAFITTIFTLLITGALSEIYSIFKGNWPKMEQLNKEVESSVASQIIVFVSEPDDDIASSSFETEGQIKDYIAEIAEENNVNPVLALKIAECESNFKNVCNYSCGCSCGIGIYQMLQSTFDEAVEKLLKERNKVDCSEVFVDECYDFSPYSIKQNIDIAIWLMSQDEYSRWNNSKHCWGNYYNN